MVNKNKKFLISVIAVIILVTVGYFVFFGSTEEYLKTNIFSGSKMTPKEVSELALNILDLPEEYEIVERTPRTKLDVDEIAHDFGWKEGYYIRFARGEELFDITVIEQSISKYPVENVTSVVGISSRLAEGYLVEELPNPNFGDKSEAVRYTDEALGLRIYQIEFSKKDVFMNLRMAGTSTDYELLKELARKAVDKI